MSVAGEDRVARMARYEAAVLAAIAAAADAGAACPQNVDLVKLIGGGFPGRASWVVARLEARGTIRVTRWMNARVVTIAATGRSTAWPDGVSRAGRPGRATVAANAPKLTERREPPVPAVRPLPRATCFKCGSSSMAGCVHLRQRGLVA